MDNGGRTIEAEVLFQWQKKWNSETEVGRDDRSGVRSARLDGS